MANPSHDANSRKCFPAIFRGLLCAGSLPTHPSDQFPDLKFKETSAQKYPPEIKSFKPEDNLIKHAATISSPGVVAKLMGLDSFPIQKDRTLGSYFRSRSVNSIDFLSHFDPINPINHHHRRVRTSVSFREGVINEDYTSVVLMEKLDETVEECQVETITRRRATEKKVAKKPRKKVDSMEEKRTSKKEMKESRPRIRVVNCKEELNLGRKCVKRKHKNIWAHDKVQSRCSMRKVHPEGSVPEIVRPVRSRKPLPSKIASSESPCSSAANSDSWEGIAAITKGKDERKMKNKESICYYKRMAEEICRVTEEDLKENCMALKFDDFEEICLELGQEILEALLRQIVDELMLIYGTSN